MTKPLRPKKEPKLLTEIALVIVCKLLFIFGLWFFFFSPEHRTQVTPEVMSEAIFGDAPANHTTQP